MSNVKHREVIENALKPFFRGRQLLNALVLWETKYSHQSHFALQHYLSELCCDMEVSHLRTHMMQALVAAVSSLHAKDEPRSHQFNRVPKQIETAQSQQHTANQIAIFTCLVESLINSLRYEMSTRTRLYILENLSSIKVSHIEKRALQHWLNHIEPLKHDLKLNEKVMQHVLHLAYVALSEYKGKFEADHIFQKSIELIKSKFPDANLSFILPNLL